MSETKIEWADYTFNPWIGCTKVAAGCLNCYAETQDRRHHWTSEGWGAGRPRRRTSEHNWNEPRRWNAKALRDGTHPRVFCGSLMDWADPEIPESWRDDLLALILATPALEWLMLSKRIIHEAPHPFLTRAANAGARNIWAGLSIAEQRDVPNIAGLLAQPAAVRFLSIEPLLEPLDLTRFMRTPPDLTGGGRIDWVIIGGESGHNARPCYIDHVRSVVEQCQAARVPAFLKQFGSAPRVLDPENRHGFRAPRRIGQRDAEVILSDPRGGNIEQWPAWARVRQWPHRVAERAIQDRRAAEDAALAKRQQEALKASGQKPLF